MMLRKAKRSHEYEKPIFENPLPNARFDANYYKLDTSWQKNFSMTPLFVPTQEKTVSYLCSPPINHHCIFMRYR